MKNRYLATVSYDGTNYYGFQIQPKQNTIQREIERALKLMTQQVIPIYVAGRTDKGVHALGQTFHFDLDFEISNKKSWIEGINKRLPSDIIIKSIKKVDHNFHARYSAKSRIYEYKIAKKPSNIFTQRFETYIPNFDINKVKPILNQFVGTKDFGGFSKKVPLKETIKTIYSLELKETQTHYKFIFHGESFLRHMIRTIMGLIIEIGIGQKDSNIIEEIFLTNNRILAGKTADAKGLFLVKVIY